MSAEDELARLIAEQERDARIGHKVFSVSLDMPTRRPHSFLPCDGVWANERPDYATWRIRGLLGHRARQQIVRQFYRGRCVDCGGYTSYNGHERCRDCWLKSKHSQDVCAKGHLFTEENTYWFNGWRYCRTCRRAASAAATARLSQDEKRRRWRETRRRMRSKMREAA